ncbi:MAG TPA: hypothetical protein V6C86_00605 [Oculatellaceae cyanobacterium]|jgi:hypothetical protein
MITRMQQLADVAQSAEKYKVQPLGEIVNEAATKNGDQTPSLLVRMAADGILTAASLAAGGDKSGKSDIAVAAGFAAGFVNEAENFIEFNPAVSNFMESMISKCLNPSANLTTVVDASTQQSLDDLHTVLKQSKDAGQWDGHSPFSTKIASREYVVGPKGEMYVHDDSTGVDTIQTSEADGTYTVVSKAKNGDVTGFTSQYNFTTTTDAAGQKILTITTKGEPPETIKLIEDGQGFDVIIPATDAEHPARKLTLRNADDINRFDLLLQHLIAMKLEAGNSYGVQNVFDQFNDKHLTLSALKSQFAQMAESALAPVLLALGSPDGKTGPTARINGGDNVPIYYDFSTGNTSIGGQGPCADFVFHPGVDVPTDGFAFIAAGVATLLRRNSPLSETEEAQVINTAISTAMAIAQSFQNSAAVDSGAALAELASINSTLAGIATVAASLAQCYVNDAMCTIETGMKKLEDIPQLNNAGYRHDILFGNINVDVSSTAVAYT